MWVTIKAPIIYAIRCDRSRIGGKWELPRARNCGAELLALYIAFFNHRFHRYILFTFNTFLGGEIELAYFSLFFFSLSEILVKWTQEVIRGIYGNY